MPPNAQVEGASVGKPLSVGPKKRIEDLSETEIAIDGVIYSLEGFEHPGGESIKLFGGNDVSVQYRMIHPFQAPGALNKMKAVGVTTTQTAYKFGSDFEKDLKESIAKIVKPNQRFATPGFWFRCVFYICLYFSLMFSYVYFGSCWQLCIALGVSQAFIGLNVQHDANHGAISPNAAINELLGFGADLIGGSKYLWLQQHWTHHAFTNDVTKDPDASSTDPFFLFHNYPTDSKMRQAIHALQHFYMLPVLSFYWASSIFNPTCISLTHTSCKDFGFRFETSYLRSKRPLSWVLRALYVACTCGSPFFHHEWQTALLHIWVLSTVESLSLAIPFALSHNFEGSERNPVAQSTAGVPGQPVDWYKSQVETSSTYGGFIAGCLTGGLNCQIEHHLFPRMSSAWYPYISKTVMEVCKRHGVRYVYYPTFWSNWFSTVRYIAAVGRGSPSPPVKQD